MKHDRTAGRKKKNVKMPKKLRRWQERTKIRTLGEVGALEAEALERVAGIGAEEVVEEVSVVVVQPEVTSDI